MNIITEKKGETLTIALEGRLDTTTAPQLENEIGEKAVGIKEMTIDMTKLEYISSAGLRVLLSTHKKMSKAGSLKITGVCEEIMDVFEMTGFSDILNIE